jgi:hypothetical protein
MWSYTSTPLHYFMVWCLIMYRDNVTFPSQLNFKIQRAKIAEVIKLKHSESVVAMLLGLWPWSLICQKGSSSQGFLKRFSSGVTI